MYTTSTVGLPMSSTQHELIISLSDKANVNDYLRDSDVPHSILYTGGQFSFFSVFRVIYTRYPRLVSGESLEVRHLE
jgi:hypothetical protein